MMAFELKNISLIDAAIRILSSINLRGYYTPNLELACFVSYLIIINTFFKYTRAPAAA